MSGKDIVSLRCVNWLGMEYDGNTWKGTRLRPTEAQRRKMADGKLRFIPGPDKVEFLGDLLDQEWVEVDSVGGTFLFVRSIVFREGLSFPTQYIVGGEWDREGYDGIETEGLCYNARFLGYKCWGLPNEVTEHAKQFDRLPRRKAID